MTREDIIEREKQTLHSERVTASREREYGRGVELKTEGWGSWWESWPENVPLPEEGEMFVVYSTGVGGQKVGVTDLEGRVVVWRIEEERKAEHRQGVLKRELEKIDSFLKHREEMDAAYDALDELLKIRIDKFRETKVDWRWQYEPYEMSACTDSMKIAEHFAGQDVDDRQEVWDRMKKLSPKDVGGHEGHSGNTWDFARLLAFRLLFDPKMVVLEHGAMTILTGCPDYGCPHPPSDEILARLEAIVPGWRNNDKEETA